jgi:hypothetical protein
MGSLFAMDHFQDTFATGLTGSKVSVTTSMYTVYVFGITSFQAKVS